MRCIFCGGVGSKAEIEFTGSKVTKKLAICENCWSEMKGLAYSVDIQAVGREGFDEAFFSLVQVRCWWKE